MLHIIFGSGLRATVYEHLSICQNQELHFFYKVQLAKKLCCSVSLHNQEKPPCMYISTCTYNQLEATCSMFREKFCRISLLIETAKWELCEYMCLVVYCLHFVGYFWKLHLKGITLEGHECFPRLVSAIAGNNLTRVEIDVMGTKPLNTSAVLIAPANATKVIAHSNKMAGQCSFVAIRLIVTPQIPVVNKSQTSTLHT